MARDDRTRIYHLRVENGQVTVRVVPGLGYKAAIIVNAEGADIFLISDDGNETLRVRLEGPKPGQKIQVLGHEDGSYDVSYQETI